MITIKSLREKLNEYTLSEDSDFVIVRISEIDASSLSRYSIVLKQGGLVCDCAGRVFCYDIASIYDDYEIEKCFITSSKSFVEKVLNGTFTKEDECSRSIAELKIDNEENSDTSSIIDKYGLAT